MPDLAQEAILISMAALRGHITRNELPGSAAN